MNDSANTHSQQKRSPLPLPTHLSRCRSSPAAESAIYLPAPNAPNALMMLGQWSAEPLFDTHQRAHDTVGSLAFGLHRTIARGETVITVPKCRRASVQSTASGQREHLSRAAPSMQTARHFRRCQLPAILAYAGHASSPLAPARAVRQSPPAPAQTVRVSPPIQTTCHFDWHQLPVISVGISCPSFPPAPATSRFRRRRSCTPAIVDYPFPQHRQQQQPPGCVRQPMPPGNACRSPPNDTGDLPEKSGSDFGRLRFPGSDFVR